MPGLLSSPVFLTFICFFSWSLHPSGARTQPNEASDVKYEPLDSNVTLACGNSQIRLPVVWHLNNSSVLPWHKVTSDGRLVLLNVAQSAQGDYSCYDNSGLLLHSVRLRLGYPPGELKISCQVPNYTHVRCSWIESVKTFLPANYSAFIWGNVKNRLPCVVNVTSKHCDVNTETFWQTHHTLEVNETNALGSWTTYSRFRLHDLLKPNPPESLRAKAQEGFPKKLMVSWNYPSSWPNHSGFPLLFQMRYRPLGSEYWSEICSEDSEVEIFDALAGHAHQVMVRARDEVNSGSQWSEWTHIILVKPWEDPSIPGPEETVEFPDDLFTFSTKPETSTTKSHNPNPEDEGNLGLVILLVLFSVFILTTILSLVLVVWVRRRRKEPATKQELTSMVKMKSMPI
ncbi:interleukin-11 receptor subunit alpha [Menidia menidia]